MLLGWESLPLLPLRCVLQHLSLEDALSAMAVCQHWRHALLIYEGRRDTMILRTQETEKNLFLTRLFRKGVQKLHVYIDCVDEGLDKFFNIILPLYLDSVKLKEILFIGPSYTNQNYSLPAAKLRRIVTESLILKNSPCIVKLGLLGCEMDVAHDDDRFMHEQLEYYSTRLQMTFNSVPSAADKLLSSTNSNLMMFSTLQHVSMDYEQLTTETLETLSQLPQFRHLSMNVASKRPMTAFNWERINPFYPNGLDVSVNVIGIPYRWFKSVIENVLVEGLSLVAFKAFFTKTIYNSVLTHLVRYYKSSLRELVWVDSPYDSIDTYHRIVPNYDQTEIDACNINPFILICWQCVNLRRLVIHGYWIWQYDILGFVRLRKTLQQLEISAIYNKQGRFHGAVEVNPSSAVRVLAVDAPRMVDKQYVRQVNELTEFEWSPAPWARLQPALRARPAPAHRAAYIARELLARTD